MSGPMTRTAYRQLIDGNLRWLNSLPRTLEREHIKRIVEASEAHEYDDNLAELETLRARVRELEGFIAGLDCLYSNPREHRDWVGGPVGWVSPGHCVYYGDPKPTNLGEAMPRKEEK